MNPPTNLTPSESARLKANEDDNFLWKREVERIWEERRARKAMRKTNRSPQTFEEIREALDYHSTPATLE